MNICNEYSAPTEPVENTATNSALGRLVLIVGQGPSAPKLWTDPEEVGDVRRSNSMIGWGATLALMVIAFLVGKLT